MKVLAGNSNKPLAEDVAAYLASVAPAPVVEEAAEEEAASE